MGWEDGEAEVFRWVFPVRHEGPGGSSVKSGEQFCTSRVRAYNYMCRKAVPENSGYLTLSGTPERMADVLNASAAGWCG